MIYYDLFLVMIEWMDCRVQKKDLTTMSLYMMVNEFGISFGGGWMFQVNSDGLVADSIRFIHPKTGPHLPRLV